MIVTWHPESEKRVIFCSHYDTRPIADQEPNRRDWTKPFVSANDGASGAAWMMELAHHMKDLKDAKDRPLKVGVDFILFDGEEYIFERDRDKYFIGSEYFASEYKKDKPKYKYVAGVLLDLFAGKNARYPLEQTSSFYAGGVQESIWKVAVDLKVPAFQNRRGAEVLDDHIALNKAGIPTVDIIDFAYPHWHLLSDTPDKCSGESMEQVARVLTVWVQRIK
jgi:glutaminyl-peptide cyclotransferase